MFNTCIKLADTPKRQTWKIKEVVVLSVASSYTTTSLKSVDDKNFQITKCFKQFSCPVSYVNSKLCHWLHIMWWVSLTFREIGGTREFIFQPSSLTYFHFDTMF